MFNTSNCSVPLVASIDGCGNNGNGFGGDGWGWIWIILIFAIFGGWGFGGNGFGGNAGNAYTDSAIQRGFDNQAVVTKLDGITQGICDSTYALNASMQNGFAGVNQALCQGFNGVERGFCNVSAQLADCCCQNREAIAQVRYDMATQACDTRNTIQNTTRDIIDNNNANTRSILDFLVQDKISSLQAENQSLKFAASQSEQNAFIAANQNAQTAELIRRLGADCPQPAYWVNPPTPVPVPNCNPCGCA